MISGIIFKIILGEEWNRCKDETKLAISQIIAEAG